MATPNVGILTTAGKALIDKVNSGQAKISFSKVVFSSMDNSQLSDTQIKALTAITPQEVVVSSPQTTLDTNSGETRIRATGNNEKLADGVYVKTYGVFAKDDTGSEILYGVTVSPNPNYFPAYDGVTPQAVTYSYKTVIQETSNITMTNSNDVYVTQEDLTEALATIPQPDLSGYDRTDDVDKKLQNKQDKLDYTPADDSKVSHLSGANNFDTVPMVNHNPLLLASSLPSDLARTGSNQEFTGKNTFDTAPIDKTTGNPYITKDGVPAVPSTLADTTKPANFTAGLQSGGVDVATAADLKSIEDSAWRQLDATKISVSLGQINSGTFVLYRLDILNKRLLFMLTINASSSICTVNVNFSGVVRNISAPSLPSFSNYLMQNDGSYSSNMSVSGNLLSISLENGGGYASSLYSKYDENGAAKNDFCFVNYDTLA